MQNTSPLKSHVVTLLTSLFMALIVIYGAWSTNLTEIIQFSVAFFDTTATSWMVSIALIGAIFSLICFLLYVPIRILAFEVGFIWYHHKKTRQRNNV